MSGFLLRIIINALVLFIAVMHLPGIFVDTLGSTLLGAAIIGLANAAIRPVLLLSQLSFDTLTLGTITLCTNFLTPFMVVKAVPGFHVSNMIVSIFSILVLTICSMTLSRVIQDR